MALFHFDRGVFRHLHWGVLGCMMALSMIGVAAIASSETPAEHHAVRQLIWVGAGLVAFVFALAIDPPWLRWLAPLGYVSVLAAVVGLVVLGKSAKGAQSWYEIGPLRLQPSEFMKIALVLLLSDLATRRVNAWRSLRGLVLALAVSALPVVAIFLQPDFGTAAVFAPVVFVMLLMGGAKIRHLLLLCVLGVGALVVLYQFLAPYQRARIQSFLEPGADVRGRDYNIVQARISLGSGQLWGRALGGEEDEEEDAFASDMEISRGRLDFLPEAHTDFIFNSLGEQFGFVGCAAVIVLYGLLTAFCIIIAVQARTLQWSLLVIGLLAILLTHVFLNLGMAMRLLPVTGLPLPYLSYGGSSMLTNFLIGGLICNVAARRYQYDPYRL